MRRTQLLATLVATLALAGGVAAGGRAPDAVAGPVLLEVPDKLRLLFPERTYVPGEVIVRYRSGERVGRRPRRGGARAGLGLGRSRGRAHAQVRAVSARPLPVARMEVLRLRRGESVVAAVRRLRRMPGVAFAEPNWVRRALADPSSSMPVSAPSAAGAVSPDDPDFGRMWNLDNTGQVSTVGNATKTGDVRYPGAPDADIDAPEAWATTTGSRAVIVAVLDSGMLYEHPDLAPNAFANPGEVGGGKEANGVDDDRNGFVDDWHGWDFNGGPRGRDDNDPYDVALHGSHVAGTIGAVGNNGIGTTGVNWNVTLLPLKILDDFGFGTVEDAVKAYAYARQQGATVVNGSFGGNELSEAELATLRSMSGTLFVFAAGNDAINLDDSGVSLVLEGEDGADEEAADAQTSYPAAFARDLPNVMAVAASTQRDGIAAFSNYGVRTVDIAAPGDPILSSYRRSPVWEELFIEDLERRWTLGGTRNEWAWDPYFQDVTSNPFKLVIRCARDKKSLIEDPGCKLNIVGSYEPSADAWMQANEPIDLTGLTECTLFVGEGHDLQKFRDFVSFEGSSDGGLTWTQVGRLTGKGFGLHEFDLSGFNGRKLQLRVRLASDGKGGGFGSDLLTMYVDGCGEREYRSEYLAGTSMATPHVSGAAALLLAKYPGADPRWVRMAIDNGADQVPTWKRRVASGGRLNLLGMLTAAGRATVPLGFDLLAPAAGAVTSATPTFAWQASGAGSGLTAYELHVDGTLAARVSVVKGRATPEARVEQPLRPGRHEWTVEAVEADGDRTRMPTRSFLVQGGRG